MRHLPQLVRALSAEPLVLERRTLDALVAVFRRKLAGAAFSGADLHAELGIAAPRAAAGDRAPAVMVIPIVGVIAQRPQSLGTSTMEIDAAFSRALADDRIDGILFDVDSPGGTVAGVPELADKIYAARGVKPMVAIANSLAGSAAYWLASAADELVVSPSGEVGSIGVYMLHEDWSKNLEQEGIKLTAIAAGTYKVEGAPWSALTPEAEAFYRQRVDEVYGWFTKAVARGRGASVATVRSGYGEGRVLSAKQALEAGMVDRVASFEETLGRLLRAKPAHRGPRAMLLREQLALDKARMAS